MRLLLLQIDPENNYSERDQHPSICRTATSGVKTEAEKITWRVENRDRVHDLYLTVEGRIGIRRTSHRSRKDDRDEH